MHMAMLRPSMFLTRVCVVAIVGLAAVRNTTATHTLKARSQSLSVGASPGITTAETPASRALPARYKTALTTAPASSALPARMRLTRPRVWSAARMHSLICCLLIGWGWRPVKNVLLRLYCHLFEPATLLRAFFQNRALQS